MNLWLNILEAFRSIRANMLRALLTIIIISFGIMAIVGVITSIEGVKYWMSSSFSTMGSNTFVIQNYASQIRIGHRKNKPTVYDPITYAQALDFKKRFQEYAKISVNSSASYQAVAKYKAKKTNSNIELRGSDESFLLTEGYSLTEGRNFNKIDIEKGRKLALIGHEIKTMLFPYESAVGKIISVNKKKYTVIGVLNERGTSFGAGGDKICVVPGNTLINDFPEDFRSFKINVFVNEPEKLDAYMSEATGMFRLSRKLKPTEDNDFSLIKSDSFVSMLMENLQILTLSATFISIITLFGASIGLTNIMLVSVKERTREIGLRKSLGATPYNILMQFLIESLVICTLGGVLGISIGLLLGNILSILLDSAFVVPWMWIFIALIMSLLVGLASGYFPAKKAAKVDPIESLRYE